MGTTTTQGTQASTTTQASNLPAWAQHSNPQVAKVLAAVANGHAGKYDSAAHLCRALGCNGKANQRQVRQVLRDAGMGVGRGHVYSGNVPAKVRKAAQVVAKANAKANRAAKAAPPAKANAS